MSTTTASKLDEQSIGAGRPRYHIAPPRGWINDPCAPGYDSSTGLYHLFYQWNPHSHVWNDISWGHATSCDMVHWQHTAEEPVFKPDQPYDQCGIFTGCFHGRGPSGEKDQLSVFYTSVNHLPITWSQPYTRGCEGLSLATSTDGGKTWEKHPDNPLLPEEPEDMHVTGFRDPFIFSWPIMDALRGTSNPALYGLISGGIHDLGPRVFLYAINPENTTQWKYLHPLTTDIPVNHQLSRKWTGDLGVNWECTNLITLRDGELSRDFLILGSEGGKEREWVDAYISSNPKVPKRVTRYSNWTSGTLSKTDQGELRLGITTGGMTDWGILYAANTFTAPDGRTILWGWIIEEDLEDELLAGKGWTGCMGVPREVFLAKQSRVVAGFSSPLQDISSVEVSDEGTSGSDLYTLGVRPIIELQNLRNQVLYQHPEGVIRSVTSCLAKAPLACEIYAVISVSDDTDSISLVLRHNEDMSIRTLITFRPKEEIIIVEREHSTAQEGVNTSPEIGSHTLFRHSDQTIEKLQLTVLLDHDVLEVFANDRFALATRVYTKPEHTGIALLSKGDAEIEELSIWSLRGIDMAS